jgi:hypothetical protein
VRAIFAICLLLAAASSAAQAATVKRVEITEFGIYTSHTDKTLDAPGAATGVTKLVSDIDLIKSTTTVPARVGVNFGFRYRIVGEGKTVTIKKITHIPEPGIRNPATGNTVVTSVVNIERTIGDVHFTSYSLDQDFEVVPGTWTMEIWIDDRKWASQSFELVKP